MDLKKLAIRYGIITGAVSVGLYLLTYSLSKFAYFGPGVYLVTWVIYLIGMWKASRDTFKAYSAAYNVTEVGYTFTQALQAPFILFLIAQTFYYLQYWAMFNIIDPSMVELAREYAMTTIDNSIDLFSSYLDDATVDRILDTVETQDYGVSFSSAFFNWARSLIGGFILSAIYALIYRKQTPQYD